MGPVSYLFRCRSETGKVEELIHTFADKHQFYNDTFNDNFDAKLLALIGFSGESPSQIYSLNAKNTEDYI